MSVVNLVSGGVDSTLVSVMAHEDGTEVFPLFVDYGQRAVRKEWEACVAAHERYRLPTPIRMNLSGFGEVIVSGLTSNERDIATEAFTPGRNLLFLLVGASYAVQKGANGVSIGLLAEELSLFPDQRKEFLASAEETIALTMGRKIRVIAPLLEFNKAEVIALASHKGIEGTYSCHAGTDIPCGECISCKEVD